MKNQKIMTFAFLVIFCLLSAPAAISAETININTASAEELTQLKGIGEVLAQRIVEYRSEFPFENKEDIMNVTGIGEAKYQAIKDHITVE
ncbi:MAG: ComEA family DNA-binding protein [Desulfonatronovibrionaceae bacterium]